MGVTGHERDTNSRRTSQVPCRSLDQDAIRYGNRAVEILPVSRDALEGPAYEKALADIYVMIGEYEAAIDKLEFLLSIPADFSSAILTLDPIYDPLRDHPRFQALLDKYE